MMWRSSSSPLRALKGRLTALRPACVALCLSLLTLPTLGLAQSVDVSQASLAQLHLAASDAYRSGQTDAAIALTQAILARAPEDALALYLQARLWQGARADKATHPAARKAARRAYAAARSEVQRYETSVLAAQIAASQERWFAANGWTRLSILAAPNAQAKAQAMRDLGTIQRLNPWQITGNLSIRPSSNVNGGAASSENRIEGYSTVGRLSTDAQALAGIEATGSVSLRYRLAETPKTRITLGGNFWARQIDLRGQPMREVFDPRSATTRREPISNSEFSEQFLRTDITHLRNTGQGRADITASLSRYWQAGSETWTGRGLSARWAFGKETVWVLDAGFEKRRYVQGREDTLRSFGIERSRDILGAGRLRTGFDWFAQGSPNANARMERLRGRIGFTPHQTFAGMIVSTEATLQQSTYSDYSFLGMRPQGGRRDDRLALRIALHRPDWSIAGITPEWTLEASRTQSNVSRFTGREFATGIGLRTSF